MTHLKRLCMGLAYLATAVGLCGPALAQLPTQDLMSIPRDETRLHRIDRATGETLSTLSIQVPPSANCDLIGGNGLATSPLTEELFAILRCGFRDGPRLLATIDTFTGVAKVIGDMGDKFAGLAFTPAGVLLAVSGRGATIGDTLFAVSTGDATSTPICRLQSNPPSGGGQALAFSPSAGLLFNANGNLDFSKRSFQSIDSLTPTDPLAPCPTTQRGPSGDPYIEATAMVFSGASFLLGDLGDATDGDFYRITNDGVAAKLGAMDHVSRGLAFTSGPAKICYRVRKAEGNPGRSDVVIEDLIVGERPAQLRLNRPFIVCVPGGIRYIQNP